MRLESVQRGTGIKRLLLPVMSWKVGARVPDVVRTLIHRPKFFGSGYNAWKPWKEVLWPCRIEHAVLPHL